MQNVITPLFRRSHSTSDQPDGSPRHRREGFFDDHDRWHNTAEGDDAAARSGG